MSDYEAQLGTLREDDEKARRGLQKATERYYKTQAQIGRIMLLQIAEKFPLVTGFSFEAEYEYDDEGGYYWSARIRPESETHDLENVQSEDDDERSLKDEIEEDHLYDVRLEEGDAMLIFETESSFEGEVTLDELRAALG